MVKKKIAQVATGMTLKLVGWQRAVAKTLLAFDYPPAYGLNWSLGVQDPLIDVTVIK